MNKKIEPLDVWVADRKKLLEEFRTTVDVIRYAGTREQRIMAERGEFDELYESWLDYMAGR